jgi:long-chain acyl-CoA synthetase
VKALAAGGDSVMMGYYRQPELTAEVITADGWFHTGDYGMFTEKGFLKITGRKKNLIILSNGKNIFPEEIENYVVRVPYVSEVVVYGQKDEAGHDTAICAEVYLSQDELKARGIEDVRAALKKDIAEACAELPSYKRISHIFVRKEPFEKTTTNKIRRNSVLGRDQE